MGLSALTGPYFIIAPLSAQDRLCPIQSFSVTLSCSFPSQKNWKDLSLPQTSQIIEDFILRYKQI